MHYNRLTGTRYTALHLTADRIGQKRRPTVYVDRPRKNTMHQSSYGQCNKVTYNMTNEDRR